MVPPGRYSIAIASANGFSFVENISAGEDPLVTLSPQCHRLRVKISGTLRIPTTIAISRVSRSVGDTFIADADSRGQAVMCLADGSYSAHAEGSITSLAMPITMPKDETIDLRGYETAVVQQAPLDLHIEHADLYSFSRSLLDRRILGLGEANHGTGDFFTYRGKLSLELARSGRLRTILIEADAIEMMIVDDYAMGKDVDVKKAVSALRFWTTDVHEFLSFLEDARTYNATASSGAKLHVLGIDAQRLEPPVRFLLAHRATCAISEREAALLARIGPDHGKSFTSFSEEDRSSVLAMLDRLKSVSSPPVGLSEDSTRVSIAARSISHQLGYLREAAGDDDLRDLAMADLAAYIVDLDNSQQTALWAHDDHVAREAAGAAKSLGQYLSARYGDAYYPIAFLSYSGNARAWDAGGEIGVIPHELGPAPPFNIESVIINAADTTDVAWVRLDTARGALQQWTATPRFSREFGSSYSPGDTQKLRALPSGVAGVVVIRHATASTPTPTGVRKVSP